MQKEGNGADLESVYLQKIIEGERIFAAKARVYSRLLTDVALAESMKEFAERSERTKSGLVALLTGEKQEEEPSEGQEENGQ